MPQVSLSTRLEHMGHALDGDGDGPSGAQVNLINYTEHLPEAYDVLRKAIERVVSSGQRQAETQGNIPLC